MAVTSGYGPLEPFLGATKGVALKGDTGCYTSVIVREGNRMNIEVVKAAKDEWCKFWLEKLDNGKVRLKDKRGIYLSRIDRGGINHIEAAKPNPDERCEFSVYTRNGKVIFQADNGLFLSRIHTDGVQNLEAAKPGIDIFCEFIAEIEDIISLKFEIIKVQFEKEPDVSFKPTAVKEYTNETDVRQSHTFKLNWERTVTETTSWESAWGLDQEVSHELCAFEIAGVAFRATILYDGTGKTCSRQVKFTEVEDARVEIPPKSHLTARLLANMDENAVIPFTAQIKKTSPDGSVQMLTEKGVWSGVAYNGNVHVRLEVDKPLYNQDLYIRLYNQCVGQQQRK